MTQTAFGQPSAISTAPPRRPSKWARRIVALAGAGLFAWLASLVGPVHGKLAPGGPARALAAGQSGPAAASGEATTPVLTVSGEGVVRAVPDLAYVTVGVDVQARTPGEAQAQSAREADRLIQALRQLGLAPADLRTIGYTVYPVRNQDGTAVVAYRARYRVRATVRDVGQVGPVIDVALRSGADEVENLQFTVLDRGALEAQALAVAVADATRRARAMAAAAGLRLGPVRSLTDGSTSFNEPYMAVAAMAEGAGRAASTPIQLGEIEVRARVQMVFTLEGASAVNP